MTTKELIEYEDGNKDTIRIYKEGLFAKAYEKSAFLLCRRKPLKPTLKFIKKVNREIVSVGMPFDKALELLKGSESEMQEKVATFRTIPLDEQEYSKWRESLLVAAPKEAIENPRKDFEIFSMIQQFDLLNSTPLDCFNFVKRLKFEVSKVLTIK